MNNRAFRAEGRGMCNCNVSLIVHLRNGLLQLEIAIPIAVCFAWQLSTTTSSVKLVDDFEPEDDVSLGKKEPNC